MKRCTKCEEEKEESAFPVRRKSKDGLGYICRACAVAAARSWRSKNRERHRAYSLRWAQEHREHVNAKCKAWRAENKEKRAKVCREWNERNQDKRAEAVARRRAKIFTPAWADKSEIAKFYSEAKRLEAETGVTYHVDHIVPLNSPIVCGLHVEANLQVIPASENILKRNLRWPDMP